MSEPNFEHAVILDAPKQQLPGTVVALAGEAGRYTRFAVCMQTLAFNIPPGTAVKWIMGSDIPESRNQAIDELHGDWVWFIDDDHAFPGDIVLKLLARDVDIVTPICLRRNQPFLPVPSVDGDYLDVTRYQPEELVEVEQAGSSGMLIRKNVIDQYRDAFPDRPLFELGDREGGGNRVSEDVNFCRRVRDMGFKIHVDMGVRLGHITTAIIWPTFNEEDERWLTGFTIADGAQLWINPPDWGEEADSTES
jgi:hypothetical protein